MFNITSGKGFQITFDNGWIVSVQWGPGNHCVNYGKLDLNPKATNDFKCEDAEVEIHHSTIEGFLEYPKSRPNEMARIMNIAATAPKNIHFGFDAIRLLIKRTS